MAKPDDESFSDDSLETLKREKKKIKRTRKPVKERTTYLKIYQQRLMKEFLKADQKSHYSAPCATPAGSKGTSSESERTMEAQPSSIIFLEKTPPSKKAPSQFWPVFLSKKNKSHKPKSESESKLKMFRKRLDYGKQMSLLNRFNMKCLNSENVRKGREAGKESNRKSTLDESSSHHHQKALPKKALNRSVKKANQMEDISKKLSLLKLRHKGDKKVAEKIKESILGTSEM